MGMFDWLPGLRESDTSNDELARVKSERDTAVFRLEEAAHSMEQLYREDAGWQQIGQSFDQEMSAEGRKQGAKLCRAMATLNPLVKRGLTIRAGYVFGQGVGIQAPDGKESGTQDVNLVVQRFLDDPGNRRSFTGAQAHEELEKQLGTDGNVYAVLFSNPKTGFTRVRTLDPLEVTDILMNPEDKTDPWFYRRDYVETTIGERTARTTTRQKTVWYPALTHKPRRRMPVIDGNPVDWSAPVHHTKVNTIGSFGVGDAYAALPWAKGYTGFLDDWAKLTKSLSRIAWQISGKKNSAQQARSSLQGIGAGGVAGMDPGTQLEAVPKTGATIDAESGRPLATMIAAALGLPVTTLLADPGQTGARAVAETLDQPTRLEMNGRREVWTETKRAIIGHVIDQAVIAPQGPLKGGVVVDKFTQQEEVILQGEADRTLTITWPEIDETSVDVMVKAIVEADATQKLPPLETMRLLLRALGVRDVDEILEKFTDDDGNYIDPNISAGDVAVDAFNRGDDPAAAVNNNQ